MTREINQCVENDLNIVRASRAMTLHISLNACTSHGRVDENASGYRGGIPTGSVSEVGSLQDLLLKCDPTGSVRGRIITGSVTKVPTGSVTEGYPDGIVNVGIPTGSVSEVGSVGNVTGSNATGSVSEGDPTGSVAEWDHYRIG